MERCAANIMAEERYYDPAYMGNEETLVPTISLWEFEGYVANQLMSQMTTMVQSIQNGTVDVHEQLPRMIPEPGPSLIPDDTDCFDSVVEANGPNNGTGGDDSPPPQDNNDDESFGRANNGTDDVGDDPFANLSPTLSDKEEENVRFGSEWGIDGESSSHFVQLQEASGAEVVFVMYLISGDYAGGKRYLTTAITKRTADASWSQEHHDKCSVLAKRFNEDLLNVENMLEKDKASEIDG